MQLTVLFLAVVALLMPAVGDIAPGAVESYEPAMISADNEGCPVGWTVMYVGGNNPFDENDDGIICARPSGQSADGHVGHPIDNFMNN